jgi:ABC-type phosphate/phosphonate transport system ATPase subunit
MDGIPVQIVEIQKDEGTRKSKYKLNSEALSEILSQISDKKVAVISIVGKSRRGKSFLLSYLIKYLSDSTNVNWIVNNEEPLRGRVLLMKIFKIHSCSVIFIINLNF